MAIKVANNAKSKLASSITNLSTSITVLASEGTRFPTLAIGDYFYATLEDTSSNIEIVKVTARVADTMTVTRGQQGTTPMSFAATTAFELRLTRDMFTEYIDQEAASIAVALAVAL